MNPFTKHPHSLDETYLQHMAAALKISGTMLLAGLACFVHSIFPFVFTNYANNTVLKLYEFYQSRFNKSE